MSVSKRVAWELGPAGNSMVGYKIRFKDRTSRSTRIKFLTDGMLLAEMQSSRWLPAYDTVILDEAHERSLNIDILAGMLKRLLSRRKDLKLIITSATMEVEKFKKFFDDPPLVQVQGRTYPVTIFYEKDQDMGGNALDLPEKVRNAVARIRDIDPFGHILVFLPSERDIFDAKRILSGKYGDECLILPLFGRLSSRDQSRIFGRSDRQKIVLATNIAETSITVPGIRYIVDSGLARISQYNINTHTKALPISRISRASADQRAGRAGRVQAGICIRLFTEEDYLARMEYTPPEILRCNLAEVILRLMYLKQGPVERFPFIDPPPHSALREGIHTLKELGALDACERLTPMGKKMARLPIDPRLSRIILQALEEGCLREILIIAAALSIQDPRQRPAKKEAEAAEAHRIFQDEGSDFISFVRLWDHYFSLKKEGASSSAIRRFCRKSFLSWPRMREWEDIFDQLCSTLAEMKLPRRIPDADSMKFPQTAEMPETLRDSVHRAILSGFLGHIAVKKDTGPGYTGTKGKELFIFPGSCLWKKGPQWIVSAEQVRTSRLFARTVAPVKPEWIEEFGRHLCKYSWMEPRWARSRGEAVCTERVSLYGLTIIPGRTRPLKKRDPELARLLLIKEGLAAGQLKSRSAFSSHNERLLEKVTDMAERQRSHIPIVDHERLEQFFQNALKKVESATGRQILDEAGLLRAIRGRKHLAQVLMLNEADMLETESMDRVDQLYPGHIELSGHRFAITYRFSPGEHDDGITLSVPLLLLPDIDAEDLEWLVPGFLEEKVEFILKHLPKAFRSKVFDYGTLSAKICRGLINRQGTFQEDLLHILRQQVDPSITEADLLAIPPLPDHLVMRIEILDGKGAVLDSSRDFHTLKLKHADVAKARLTESHNWKIACARWEKKISVDDLDSLPEQVKIGKVNGIAMAAWPAVTFDQDREETRISLMPSRREAAEASDTGLRAMLKAMLRREIRHSEKLVHQRIRSTLKPAFIAGQAPALPCLNAERLTGNIIKTVLRHSTGNFERIPSASELKARAQEARKRLVHDTEAVLKPVLKTISAWHEYSHRLNRLKMRQPGNYGRAAIGEIERMAGLLIGKNFPADRSLAFIRESHRYAQALGIRLQRAMENPARDRVKQLKFQPVMKVLEQIHNSTGADAPDTPITGPGGEKDTLEMAAWEFMISIFAPELAVKGRISEKKLKDLLSGAG